MGGVVLRSAEGLSCTVVDVLVVDEDCHARHSANLPLDDKSPSFPAGPGRRGAMAESYQIAPSLRNPGCGHSHSMVAGGLDVMS